MIQEEKIQASGTEKDMLVLAAWGVPWNVTLFCKSCERACRVDGYPDSSKTSTSLSQLEVKKQFIERRGSRTLHIKLTELGRKHAKAKRADPRTWQEKRAEETAHRRANAIAYESARFGDQMSEGQLYINLAREAYYLTQLFNIERANPYEVRSLLRISKRLRESGFNPPLFRIVNHTRLSIDQAQEARYILDALHG